MESPFTRERSMPFFLLASMIFHALLFLIAPKVISGMFPSTHLGEQGGLTYVTLVDAPESPRPRAAVAEAARRPQVRPTPQPRPAAEPATPASATPVVQPQQPQPQSAVTPPQPSVTPRPAQPRPEPVVTNPRPDAPVDDTDIAEAETTQSVADDTEAHREDGVDLREAVASLPDADTDPEPQRPPAGESMLSSFGGSTFPKNAVGLFRGSVEVEVAAIVAADGRLIDAIVVDGSGISVVDTHAENVVRHLIQFKPYDDMYEMRVFITFNSEDQDRLHFRYSEFITSPPTVGRFGTEGGL